MDFRIGGQFFASVTVPVLWGSRAILRDQQGHLSIVNLEGDKPAVEVIDDQPHAGTNFSPSAEGYVILNSDGEELYSVNPTTKTLIALCLRLPPITVSKRELHVGANVFDSNLVVGIGVGILVNESGLALGGSLPAALATLRV
jgi:hypothetical protein